MQSLNENIEYEFSFLVTKYKTKNVWYLYNWLNTKYVFIDDYNHPLFSILDDKKDKFELFEFSEHKGEFEYLLEENFIVTNQDYVREIVRKKYQEINNHSLLELTLMPVNQACNFRCLYCYENSSLNEFMTLYDKEILLKYIYNNNILDEIRIDYFGGEPLLNIDFILDFHKDLQELLVVKKIKHLPSSMATNGYLLNKKLFLKLLNCNILTFQITLDGLPTFHNKYRPLVDGSDTFEVIYNNLLEISNLSKDKCFTILIRMNFSRESITKENRSAFFDKIKKDFGNDNRFIFQVQPICDWSQYENKKFDYCSEKEGKELQRNVELELESSNLESLYILQFSGLASHYCYAGRSNNLIIYPSDKQNKVLPIQKCTLGVGSEYNNVGHINENGELIIGENMILWTKDNFFKLDKCMSCFFVTNCYANSCVRKNYLKNTIICPDEKFIEVELAQRIISYITKH